MADDRSLGELGRDLTRLEQDVKEKLSKDLYLEAQKALETRFSRVERDVAQLYDRVRTAVWVFMASVAATVTGGIILATMMRK